VTLDARFDRVDEHSALHEVREPGVTTGPLQEVRRSTSPLEREAMTIEQKHFAASELARTRARRSRPRYLADLT
jgi:hypothetical protein